MSWKRTTPFCKLDLQWVLWQGSLATPFSRESFAAKPDPGDKKKDAKTPTNKKTEPATSEAAEDKHKWLGWLWDGLVRAPKHLVLRLSFGIQALQIQQHLSGAFGKHMCEHRRLSEEGAPSIVNLFVNRTREEMDRKRSRQDAAGARLQG